MFLLDLTLDTPARNLALDEALLDWAEETEFGEVLRIWEPESHFVVVGRSSKLDLEVNQTTCQREGIPLLRRCSGGAAIVAGPGCLMYAVVLSCHKRPALRDIDQAHSFVLGEIASALAPMVPGIQRAGTSDLVIESKQSATRKKVSGNSMRIKRDHLLYHGTLLYDFDLSLVGEYLLMPPRQPDYREARSHTDFVSNLTVTNYELRQALISGWQADQSLADWPREKLAQLMETRYGKEVSF